MISSVAAATAAAASATAAGGGAADEVHAPCWPQRRSLMSQQDDPLLVTLMGSKNDK